MQDLILSMVSGIRGSLETHPLWIRALLYLEMASLGGNYV